MGNGKAGHARGADLGQVGEQVQAVHAAGRRDRQHGAGKPCTTPGLRAEIPLAPQDGRPDGSFGHVVGGFDPGDIQIRPEGRPQGVDACAHPSHPEVSRPGGLGQELAEPGLHPACPALVGPQGRPVLHEGGPVGEEGAVEAPGPHPDVGAVATTGDQTLEVPGEVCPAQQRKLRRVQPVVACVAVAGDHAVVVRQGQLPDHPATATGCGDKDRGLGTPDHPQPRGASTVGPAHLVRMEQGCPVECRDRRRGHWGECLPGCMAKGVDAADADRHLGHLPHNPGCFPAAQAEPPTRHGDARLLPGTERSGREPGGWGCPGPSVSRTTGTQAGAGGIR